MSLSGTNDLVIFMFILSTTLKIYNIVLPPQDLILILINLFIYFGDWNREKFITGPCKEMGGLHSKSLKVTESFQQAPLRRNVKEGHG